jgi:MobA/VirD2-like, nuclease domain
MILKASQRGGAGQLAAHLLNTSDNDHVELYEISGFISDTLHDALQEARAQSMGTRCQQYLFSVSLNPPETEIVDAKVFEKVITRIQESLNLQEQPRVIVFHEKEGRRHAHAVWSRIDTQEMKAINLPYYKNKLMEISKQLYLEQGWKLPQGLINREQSNPLNFTRAQWEQAKRLDDDPRTIKSALKECWAISDSKEAFQNALEQRGYYLAKGDRRGYVAVDWRGQVFSLSKWLGERNKAIKVRLGDSTQLPSISETVANIDAQLVKRTHGFINELRQNYHSRLAPLLAQKTRMKARHQTERQTLTDKQKQRWQQESKERQVRLNKGLQGLWDRLTGKHRSTKNQNYAEAYQAFVRDKVQRENLIQRQLQERRTLQQALKHMLGQRKEETQHLKEMLFSSLSPEKAAQLKNQFEQRQHQQNDQSPQHGNDYDLSM